jgi:hypothetical protein
MTLSDEDRRRIDEEEYRKLSRERLERTVRVEADIRTSGDQRVEVRGVGTEMYRDAKGAAKSAASTAASTAAVVGNVIAWLLVVVAAYVALVLICYGWDWAWIEYLSVGAVFVLPGSIIFGLKMYWHAQRVK